MNKNTVWQCEWGPLPKMTFWTKNISVCLLKHSRFLYTNFCHIWASPFSKTHISTFHSNSVLTTQQWKINICFKLITIHAYQVFFTYFFFHDLWPTWFCWTFHNCLVNRIIFGKNTSNSKYVRSFIIPTTLP